MKTARIPQANDYIKTAGDRFRKEVWRGKIRRKDEVTGMYLIEWNYCGGLPTDICTYVFEKDLVIVRRPKS